MQDNLQSFEMELMSSLSGVAKGWMLHHWHGKRITGCYCLVATCWTRLIFAGVTPIHIFIQVLNSVNQGINSIEQKVLGSSHADATSRRICWTPLSHLWVWVWNKWLQIRACIANPRIFIFMFCPSISIISFETWIMLNSTAPIGALRSTEAQQVSQTLGRCPRLIWGSRAKWIKANFRPSGLMSSLSV